MSYNIRRKVGLELECAGRDDYRPRTGIEYIYSGEDGSVGGDDYYTGHEFKFTKGLSGGDVTRTVRALTKFINERGYRVKNVYAGMHLHLDYNIPNNYSKALNLVDIADSIYPFLLTKVSKERHGNEYCEPINKINVDIKRKKFVGEWQKPTEIIREIEYYDYDYEIGDSYLCQSLDRHLWIHTSNLQDYRYNSSRKNTVEVRLHQATKSFKKIMTWIEFWSVFSLKCDRGQIDIMKNTRQYNRMVRSLSISSETRARFLC